MDSERLADCVQFYHSGRLYQLPVALHVAQ